MVTGDNATGKTTLLKAIALGLCDQSSAAGLLRESDSGYIRRNDRTATIDIELRSATKPNLRRQIRTELRTLAYTVLG